MIRSLAGYGFVFVVLLMSCRSNEALFQFISPAQSGIHFVNEITESDSFNILNTEFIYNGAGVAVGDLNGDGLDDLFFAGNQVDNACYLNKGEFKFIDITKEAGLTKPDKAIWSSGVTIIDLNADGRNDIYLTNTLRKNVNHRKNLFYLNLGNTPEGIPTFREQAETWGLADTSYASHAQFFDFDRDGDLDLFIGTNYIDRPIPGQYKKHTDSIPDLNADKLYRNDWDSVLKEPRYTDISLKAGLVKNGYSHSSLIYDFNQDGWPDIYIANDYQSDDLIYINDQRGGFINQNAKIFRHQSSAAMGSDLGDINNDGQEEIITAEMLPFTNFRKKTLIGPASYTSYIYVKQYGYQYQFTRNTLQFHQGLHQGWPVFSEISFLAGVHETEWSWAPLFADFDLDGYLDLYITNGFPKDVTDHDFGEYRSETSNLLGDMELQNLIPVVRVSNFMFQNQGNLKFKDVTKDWGVNRPSFSNGAAYADLDLDGDLDLVIHNIDEAPYILRNNKIQLDTKSSASVTIQLQGDPLNPTGIGSKVVAFYNQGTPHTRHILSGRGYLSQPGAQILYGLGTSPTIDSVQVVWADGSITRHGPIPSGTRIVIHKGQDLVKVNFPTPERPLMQSIDPASKGLDFKHQERDFIDFTVQKTLPFKMSQYGVPMGVADLNQDGLEDLVIGASAFHKEYIFFQLPGGKFRRDSVMMKLPIEIRAEDSGLAILDLDHDDDLDLVWVGGSYENYNSDREVFNLRAYLNNGAGQFTRDTTILPPAIRTNASAIRAADIDNDGDLDLFISGHVVPGSFPLADRSYVLINESENGKAIFKDESDKWLTKDFPNLILNDAIFTDFNNDHKPDLVLAPLWGPVTILENQGNRFQAVLNSSISSSLGWWTSLASGDLNNDGFTDYIAGNYGENLYFQCTTEEPITIYAKDFDQNGSIDPFISCYWRDTNGVRREYFFHGRDDMIKQLISIRRKFQTYTAYGSATVRDVFSDQELSNARISKANFLSSAWVLNHTSQFTLHKLPVEAQLAPLYGILPMDIDLNGRLDLALGGNDFGMELIQGLADASHGLILLNRDTNILEAASIQKSGFFHPGEMRSMLSIAMEGNEYLIIQMNREVLKMYRLPDHLISMALQPDEWFGRILEGPGKNRKLEGYPGQSFKSLRWGKILIPKGTTVELINTRSGAKRTVQN
jgi:enediyne biosynthesis protein E4